jgi:hypothetical protein
MRRATGRGRRIKAPFRSCEHNCASLDNETDWGLIIVSVSSPWQYWVDDEFDRLAANLLFAKAPAMHEDRPVSSSEPEPPPTDTPPR